MPRKKKALILTEPVRTNKAVKVRLDARTIITLASEKALGFWRQRYPNLEVIS